MGTRLGMFCIGGFILMRGGRGGGSGIVWFMPLLQLGMPIGGRVVGVENTEAHMALCTCGHCSGYRTRVSFILWVHPMLHL